MYYFLVSTCHSFNRFFFFFSDFLLGTHSELLHYPYYLVQRYSISKGATKLDPFPRMAFVSDFMSNLRIQIMSPFSWALLSLVVSHSWSFQLSFPPLLSFLVSWVWVELTIALFLAIELPFQVRLSFLLSFPPNLSNNFPFSFSSLAIIFPQQFRFRFFLSVELSILFLVFLFVYQISFDLSFSWAFRWAFLSFLSRFHGNVGSLFFSLSV